MRPRTRVQVVECGMMGARTEPVKQPQSQVKPQPQVVQCEIMGARIVPNEQRNGEGVESSRSQ